MLIYLDNSATTRPFKAVAETVNNCLTELYFNPASAYPQAVSIERKVEQVRLLFTQALFASPAEIIFTSGGTESNNIAIAGATEAMRNPQQFITTSVEHPSVFEVFRRLETKKVNVEYAGVDSYGAVQLDEFKALLNENTSFISMMHVNNEVGAINDIEQAHRLIKEYAPQALFHVDGVQAFCKLPFAKLLCDMYSISGHKFNAPKGVGLLYVRKGTPFAGGFLGGGQERGLRSGTTNVPGILGMGEALNQYSKNQNEWLNGMRACKLRLAANIKSIKDTLVNGPDPQKGAPHILNISFLGVRGEVLLHALAEKGILVSTGSACSARKKNNNRVLHAMGIAGERLDGAVRFSFCPFNTLKEMDDTAQILSELVTDLRKFKRK